MKTAFIPIDSEILGGPVLSLDGFTLLEDFREFERHYRLQHDPVYVTAKVPIENIAEVHALEDHGFRLIECQIRSRKALVSPHEVKGFPYAFTRAESPEALDSVLEIARKTFKHDRFTVDPLLGPSLSGRRYERYVKESFNRADEGVYRLHDPDTGQTVAFKTHRILPGGEALLLLGGVHPDFQNLGLGAVNDFMEFNALLSQGMRGVTTHISAGNYPIFRMEIGKMGFRVMATYAVLRKVYARPWA